MTTQTHRNYVDSEMLADLDREIARSTWPAARIHQFERWQYLRGANTPQTIKRLYLVFATLFIGLALLLSTAALWLVDSTEAALSWTSSDEADPLYERRRKLLDRGLRVEYPRAHTDCLRLLALLPLLVWL